MNACSPEHALERVWEVLLLGLFVRPALALQHVVVEVGEMLSQGWLRRWLTMTTGADDAEDVP